MNINGTIYIAGHNGMVGSAIYRKLSDLGWEQKIGMTEGLKRTYEWYLENVNLNTFKS